MLSVQDNTTKDVKSALSSLLHTKGDAKEESKSDSGFSALLSQLKLSRVTSKEVLIQNGSQALPQIELTDTQESKGDKKASLLQLLLHEKVEEEADTQLDSPTAKEELNGSEHKHMSRLIFDAKRYLKDKITTKAEALGVEIEKMPKTLKGLVALAKDVGIKVESISVEEIQQHKGLVHQKKLASDDNVALKEKKIELKSAPQLHSTKKETHNTKEVLPQEKTAVGDVKDTKDATDPLLRGMKSHSTQEIVVAKGAVHVEEKLSKHTTSKGSESKPLEALLKGEDVKEDKGKPNNTLSKLLHVSAPTTTTVNVEDTKSDAVIEEVSTSSEPKSIVNVAHTKESELELKVKEAKEFVAHFASEIKEEIKNYKPPFVRLKMKLNPAKMGEVDVTLVQRGHNVHININSNTTAITTLMQNSQELKNQLNTNGISNATMNFQSGSNEHNQNQQQHNRQQEMKEAYEKFNNSEDFESIATALEIIVPRYV